MAGNFLRGMTLFIPTWRLEPCPRRGTTAPTMSQNRTRVGRHQENAAPVPIGPVFPMGCHQPGSKPLQASAKALRQAGWSALAPRSCGSTTASLRFKPHLKHLGMRSDRVRAPSQAAWFAPIKPLRHAACDLLPEDAGSGSRGRPSSSRIFLLLWMTRSSSWSATDSSVSGT